MSLHLCAFILTAELHNKNQNISQNNEEKVVKSMKLETVAKSKNWFGFFFINLISSRLFISERVHYLSKLKTN